MTACLASVGGAGSHRQSATEFVLLAGVLPFPARPSAQVKGSSLRSGKIEVMLMWGAPLVESWLGWDEAAHLTWLIRQLGRPGCDRGGRAWSRGLRGRAGDVEIDREVLLSGPAGCSRVDRAPLPRVDLSTREG